VKSLGQGQRARRPLYVQSQNARRAYLAKYRHFTHEAIQ
jgi:hypothetical protein